MCFVIRESAGYPPDARPPGTPATAYHRSVMPLFLCLYQSIVVVIIDTNDLGHLLIPPPGLFDERIRDLTGTSPARGAIPNAGGGSFARGLRLCSRSACKRTHAGVTYRL